MIYIRVDANARIAMGHLMRTIAIAEAIRESGSEVCFITADDNCDAKLKEHNFERICLNSIWNDMNREIPLMKQVILERDIKCLLIDSYFVTKEYFEELSKVTNLVYVDDFKILPTECKAIINYVIGETSKGLEHLKNELYMGAEYVPLRKEFMQNPQRLFGEKIGRILVTTGGSDELHFGKNFMQAILNDERFRECLISLVVGSKNDDREFLLSAYKKVKNVSIYVDAKNMSELMQEADCMVSAGGTTLYEACACKLPTVSYAVADNQLLNVQKFDELGEIYFAGDIRDGINAVVEKILDRLQEMQQVEMRQNIAKCMGKVVDGKGAYRIADILIKIERNE